MPRLRRSTVLVAAVGAAAFGCATSQRVSLECVPRDVLVYVDGRLLEGVPKAVKLAKDEPHTVFLKGSRYQAQMVVFESRERDGGPVLEPVDLCSGVAFVEVTPEVTIEVEPETPQAPSR
jgi:hypothetical protein